MLLPALHHLKNNSKMIKKLYKHLEELLPTNRLPTTLNQMSWTLLLWATSLLPNNHTWWSRRWSSSNNNKLSWSSTSRWWPSCHHNNNNSCRPKWWLCSNNKISIKRPWCSSNHSSSPSNKNKTQSMKEKKKYRPEKVLNSQNHRTKAWPLPSSISSTNSV